MNVFYIVAVTELDKKLTSFTCCSKKKELQKNSPRKTGTVGQNQRHKKSIMCNLYISTFDLSLVEMGD